MQVIIHEYMEGIFFCIAHESSPLMQEVIVMAWSNRDFRKSSLTDRVLYITATYETLEIWDQS